MSKITDMFIAKGDARYVTGPLKKAKAAVPAVPEKKDKEGKVTQKAVEGKAAQPAVQTMYVFAKNQKILDEIIARMTDAGVAPIEGEKPKEFGAGAFVAGWNVSNTLRITFKVEKRQTFTEAFKKVKSKEHYNKAGWKILEADRKAKDAAKREKEKEKEKAAKKEPAKKADSKKGASSKKLSKNAPKKPAEKGKADAKADPDDEAWGEE